MKFLTKLVKFKSWAHLTESMLSMPNLADVSIHCLFKKCENLIQLLCYFTLAYYGILKKTTTTLFKIWLHHHLIGFKTSIVQMLFWRNFEGLGVHVYFSMPWCNAKMSWPVQRISSGILLLKIIFLQKLKIMQRPWQSHFNWSCSYIWRTWIISSIIIFQVHQWIHSFTLLNIM
jgi:hypothetical protein